MELQIYEIQNKIYEIRGRRVIIDFDLAEMYGVTTKALKQAVRRNISRFPDDFLLTLSNDEYNALILNIRSQFVTLESEEGKGKYPKYAPFAFTELGVAMLSSVLHSEKAIQANIRIMRAFVTVREYLLSHTSLTIEMAQLRDRILCLEQTKEQLERTDEKNLEAINDLSENLYKELANIYNAISALSARTPQLDPNRRLIGFKKNSTFDT